VSVRILLTIAAFFLAAAAAAHNADTAGSAGLYGKVVIEPAMPVCRPGVPCSRPAKELKLAFLQNGHVVKTTPTDERGRYRIALAPGRYAVRPRTQQRLRNALEPAAVKVTRGRFTKRNFTLDVGIR
jgi:hypothetical protein